MKKMTNMQLSSIKGTGHTPLREVTTGKDGTNFDLDNAATYSAACMLGTKTLRT